MSETQETQTSGGAVALEASTLEEVVDALASGKAIALPLNSGTFSLQGEDACAVLRFYAGRRDLWPQQKQLSPKEIDEIVLAVELPKPVAGRPRAALHQAGRPRWRITRVEVHRFAGLHRHCDAKGHAPELLTVELDRDVTCVWGFNGAGKTAFQSAIMWCLTGRALRSQHRPDEIHEPMSVEMATDDSDATPPRTLSIPPIVPLPSAAELAALQDRPALDTWVQLTLRDRSGREVQIRRSLVQSPRGALTVQVQGLGQLDLPDLAIEAGTLMPAIAATMRFDEKTTFAAAIAQLTGLKPLEDLGRRAVRLEKRLSGEEITHVENAKAEAFTRFASSKRTFAEAWEANLDALGPLPDLLSPDQETPDKSCLAAIESAKEHLERARDGGQSDIATILGAVPQLGSKEQVTAFINLLNEAKDHLGAASIGSLPSIVMAKRVAAIDASERASARALLSSLRDRAQAQVARLNDQARAARWQLYALVGQWHKQHHAGELLADCPVCGSDLEQVPPDALLDAGIADALRMSMEADADVAKSLQEWQRDAASELLESLPQTLRPFADASPPASLLDVYRSAFVTELLAPATFSNQLRRLKRARGVAARGRRTPVARGSKRRQDQFAGRTGCDRARHPICEPAGSDRPRRTS